MTTVRQTKLYFFIISTIITGFLLGSWDNISSIDALVKVINENHHLKDNDAIYIHTDKPYYMAGENIWFKVYLRKSSTLLPTKWSKGVYVELLAPNGDIIDEREIYGDNKYSNGDFQLRTDLPEGRYRIRAYTNWMRNFGDSTFYNQEIQIYQINPDSLRASTPKLDSNIVDHSISNRRKKYDVQFFPEGGQFIENITTKMGVKVVNQNGYGEVYTGKIYNQENKLITTFKGNELGIGSFYIIGKAIENYYAILDCDTVYNNPNHYPLPKVNEKGTSLFVVNKNALYIKIITTDNSLKNGGYLIASSKGKVLYSWTCPPNRKLIPIKHSLENFNNGVIKLTLLNDQLQPIVERVVFNYKPHKVDISLNKETYKKREKVEVEIELKDEQGIPLTGDASIAVVDKAIVDLSQKKNNIISQLLLSDEIKGNIENPSWYFDDFSVEKMFALDDLMLTQGYRKINWIQNAIDTTATIQFIPEPGISFRGKTSNYWNEKKAQQSEITMTTFDHNVIHESTITDKNGGFTFTGMVFFDTTNFFFQAKKYNDKKNKVTKNNSISISLFEMEPPIASPIEDKMPPLPKGNSLAEFEKAILDIEKVDRAFNTKTIVLDEIEIIDTSEPEEFQPSTKLHSNYRQRFVTDSMTSAMNLTVWQFLQQEMRTAQVLRRSNVYNVTTEITDEGESISYEEGEIPVVLDGFQVDVMTLESMMMSEIGFIDVLDITDGALYVSNASNGVIAIYSKQGGGGSYVVKGIDNIVSPGYYTSREFYQPKYDVPKEEHAKPDYRITLLWEPNIIFNEKGQAKVTFYTNDKKSNYQIELEGISNKGKPFNAKYDFSNN